MARSRADVATEFASKYLVQLSKHWSHRFAVEWDETRSRIPFSDAAECRLEVRDSGLVAELDAPEAELERLQGVVADHVNRFAHKEGPRDFVWMRAD